ncbi:MAG: DUF4331 family protein [bacterium]
MKHRVLAHAWPHCALTATLLVGVLAVATKAPASSHREAPAISEDPAVDDTDAYALVSPEHPDKVVLVGNWFPAEEPSGGPNYFRFSDAAFPDQYRHRRCATGR